MSRSNKGCDNTADEKLKPEKKWKLLYLRSEKLLRARQLGFEYPRKSDRQLALEESGSYEQ